MTRKKLDNRIRILIENAVAAKHRALFVVVGDKGKDQVVILHHILSKSIIAARPSVLWCYKKDLGFTSHRRKRMKELNKRLKTGKLNIKEDDPFELFIASTQIRYCYYHETHTILGNTFGCCVLQDFESLTPNLLARTIETVNGGGLVILLLKSMQSLQQLYTITMDVHSRYRTEAHTDVVGRFNERFILSLSKCNSCMVVDDELNVLPITAHSAVIEPVPAKLALEQSAADEQLAKLQASMVDTPPLGVLLGKCRTACQAKVLLRLLDVVTEKTLRATCSVTAARGRGKSAALGLAVSGAIAFGYTNIFVTSPSPENLHTLFQFIVAGFDAMKYQEHMDYELIQSTNPDFNKAVVRLNVFREHRQTVQYLSPSDAAKLGQCELLVIDEAAAIPLPLVKSLFGPYLIFLASTINGYEGTGRSLSLKLLQQLRQQSSTTTGGDNSQASQKALTATGGRVLHELKMDESIRYRPGDPIETWLNQLLCLDATSVHRIQSGCPAPKDCSLYYVNRDTLFSYHQASETFLQRMMSIYVAAHYKNSPNDLQLLSDAPAHHLFVLLGPVQAQQNTLPEILVVVQVCLEGEISKASMQASLSRGKRASGDLIPWTVAQQFSDNDFASLSGARIVRIATHPDYQSWLLGMGYGGRALSLLYDYYCGRVMTGDNVSSVSKTSENGSAGDDHDGKVSLLTESIRPRANLPPLLLRLDERNAECLHYMGVSFGVSLALLKFWKRAGFVPVYLRQTANDLTGEHSCIMLKNLQDDIATDWLHAYWLDFRRRLISLLSYEFSAFTAELAISLLHNKTYKQECKHPLTRSELSYALSNGDMRRLQLYAQNMVDHHLITDLIPTIAKLYFTDRLQIKLSAAQAAILVGVGLQHHNLDKMATGLSLPTSQVMALYNKIIRKFVDVFGQICEKSIAAEMDKELPSNVLVTTKHIEQTLEEDLDEGAADVEHREQEKMKKAKKNKPTLLDVDPSLREFAIRGSEDDWKEALDSAKTIKGIVSVKRSVNESASDKMPDLDALDESHGPAVKRMKKKKKMNS